MQGNAEIIERFYRAFQQRDADSMAACYHDDIVFSDPVFGELRGSDAGDMWRMLCERGKDLSIEYRDVSADAESGSAHWEAHYTFSATGRQVHNKIDATFEFRDGLISRHRDVFSFWSWSSQALGPAGALLGWTPFIRKKVSAQALGSLAAFTQR